MKSKKVLKNWEAAFFLRFCYRWGGRHGAHGYAGWWHAGGTGHGQEKGLRLYEVTNNENPQAISIINTPDRLKLQNIGNGFWLKYQYSWQIQGQAKICLI